MKVYISSKLGIYRKWLFIVVSPLAFVGSLVTFWQYFTGVHCHKGEFWGGLLWLVVSLLLYFSASTPGILFVDGDTIILRGIFKVVTYHTDEFAEFKEVKPKSWFGYSSFYISFKDGKSYWFECEANLARYNYMRYHSKEEVINDLNHTLENAIQTCSS